MRYTRTEKQIPLVKPVATFTQKYNFVHLCPGGEVKDFWLYISIMYISAKATEVCLVSTLIYFNISAGMLINIHVLGLALGQCARFHKSLVRVKYTYDNNPLSI